MSGYTLAKKASRAAMTAEFHERFDIGIGPDDARARCVNRVRSKIFWDFMHGGLFNENTRAI